MLGGWPYAVSRGPHTRGGSVDVVIYIETNRRPQKGRQGLTTVVDRVPTSSTLVHRKYVAWFSPREGRSEVSTETVVDVLELVQELDPQSRRGRRFTSF